jgi:hypothetical protein
MTAIPLRRWLSKQPHPSIIVADMADGSEKRVRLGVARSKFRDAEEALTGAVSCEALDEAGCVLRTWESGAEKTDPKAVDPKVAEGQMLVALANVLAQVADASVKRYESIMQLSFEQNAKLLGLLSGRLSAIEKLYHSSLIAQAEALRDEADALAEKQEDNDPNLPLVTQLLGQALNGGREKDT